VPLASRKGLELIILFDETLPLLLIGDPDRMKQVLMNLIGNAIKFSTTGNVVVEFWHKLTKREDITRTKHEQSTSDAFDILSGKKLPKRHYEDELDDSKLGDEVILHCSVKDQGIGMTAEEQKMLFVSFQQTDSGTTRKYGGTGLGLSICSQLISHMNGKVTVESEKGKGAKFTFTAKLRTETEYDVEQNPVESNRITECCRILGARMDMIDNKRVLILSPNLELRKQLTRILKRCVCYEFDDVGSAVAAGMILMTGESTREQPETMDVNSEGRNETGPDAGNAGDKSGGAHFGWDNMLAFDFILVDHVLDSAELDRIYPSPIVAFVLLLAPTTETLRWILPPAANRVREEPEEPDYPRKDLGGRGRSRTGGPDFLSSTMIAQENKADSVLAIKAGPPETTIKIPSQLFKKRKSRGHITVTRSIPQPPGAKGKPKMETTTFQVCRLIKPVRRMKILQIFYNALSKHRDLHIRTETTIDTTAVPRNSEPQEQDIRTSGFGYEITSRRKRCALPDRALSPMSSTSSSPMPMSPTSPCSLPMSPILASSSSASPLKRRRDQTLPDVIVGDQLKRCHKPSRSISGVVAVVSHPNFASLDPFAEKDPPRSLGLSGAAIGEHESNLPKRARNNDALTLLLTPEERKRCRGKNVLVAEDDFVSQKILEK